MSDIKVIDFAEVLKIPVDKLISQLSEAGIEVNGGEDKITEDVKVQLLAHLRKSHGRDQVTLSSPKKITLKRKAPKTPSNIILFLSLEAKEDAIKPIMIALSAAITISIKTI